MKILKWLNGLPGILLAASAAFGVFQLYVHQREVAAVAQAELQHAIDQHRHDDSVRVAQADSVVHAWQDSTAKLKQREQAAKNAAASANQSRIAFHDVLHQLVDTNAVLKAAVDSLESAHARQVLSLTEALARADSTVQADSSTIMQLHARLIDFQRSNVDLLKQLDDAKKRLNPSLGKQLVGLAPWVALAGVAGYAAGSR